MGLQRDTEAERRWKKERRRVIYTQNYLIPQVQGLKLWSKRERDRERETVTENKIKNKRV